MCVFTCTAQHGAINQGQVGQPNAQVPEGKCLDLGIPKGKTGVQSISIRILGLQFLPPAGLVCLGS